MKKIVALILLTVVVAGCQKPYWTLADDLNNVVKGKSFKVTVPEGWIRTTEPDTWDRVEIDGKMQTVPLESVSTTRDGTRLQAITVTRRFHDTSFPHLKKKTNANMLPVEVADLYVSELRKSSGLERLKVLSNKPATVGGKPAFRLEMEYKNDDGLRIRLLSYGYVDKTGFYTLNYRAPYLYYFERDYKRFVSLVLSFKELKGANEPAPELPAWAKLFT